MAMIKTVPVFSLSTYIVNKRDYFNVISRFLTDPVTNRYLLENPS